MKIIIITTENTLMKETGFGSMNACLAVKSALEELFHEVSIHSCLSVENLENIIKLAPDFVVLAIKYLQLETGEKIWLSQYFEEANLNYTGSKRDVLEYDSDKIKAKALMIVEGIKTAAYVTLTPENYLSLELEDMPYPLFLKPFDAANGNGIDDESIVNNDDAFNEKAKSLFSKYGPIAIAETYLPGREFTVAVIHNAVNNLYTVSPIEIIPPLNKDHIRMLGEKVKHDNSEEYKCVTDEILMKNLKKIAVKAFKVLGIRDFGRIDIKLDENGICHFIEANLVPGMTKGSSYFPLSLELNTGLSYSDIVKLMVVNATSRSSVVKISL